MRISELSRRSGVPTTTIKFYIREALVPAGARSQRNQATYDEAHLERLDLIRALREVAHLPLEVVREVIDQLGKPWGEADPVGAAMDAIYRVPDRDRNASEQKDFEDLCAEVTSFMHDLDWVLPDTAQVAHPLNIESLADAITQMRRYIDPDFSVEVLRGFASTAWRFSETVYESNEDRVPRPGDDLVDPTRVAILGTLLLEPLLMGLVRTALVMRSMRISAGMPLPPTD